MYVGEEVVFRGSASCLAMQPEGLPKHFLHWHWIVNTGDATDWQDLC